MRIGLRGTAEKVARAPHTPYMSQTAHSLVKLGTPQVALHAPLGHGVQHNDQRRAAEHGAGAPVRQQQEVLEVVVVVPKVNVAAGASTKAPAPHAGAAESGLVLEETSGPADAARESCW